jgi:hypothetical protein
MSLVPRLKLCFMCSEPIPQSSTGRPRKTCGERCRQRMHRKTQPPSVELQAKRKDAWKTIRQWERRFGALTQTYPEWGGLTLRDRLLIRLQRDWPIAFCSVCTRPFMPDAPDATPKQCSAECARTERTLRRRTDSGAGADALPEVVVELREKAKALNKRCKHCGIVFAPTNVRQEYHSGACRTAAYRKRWGKCEQCGEKYRRVKAHQRYCKRPCERRAMAQRRRAAWLASLPPAICRWCGETIDRRSKSQRVSLKYCDSICRSRYDAFRRGDTRRLPRKSPLRMGEYARANVPLKYRGNSRIKASAG